MNMKKSIDLLLTKQNHTDSVMAYRCEDGFRLVSLNDAFTDEVEEVLSEEECTDELLKRLGLSYKFLPFNLIEDVAYDETGCGEVVISTRDKRYRYISIGDYEDGHIDLFFEGVPRKELPKRKQRVKEDWRKEKQNPAVVKHLKYANAAINVVCFVCLFSQIGIGSGWVSLLCALLFVGAVVLCVTLPQYFSFMDKRTRRHYGYTAYAVDLCFPVIGSGVALSMGFLRAFTVINTSGYLWLLIIAAAATASFILVMHMLCRDFKEHFGAVFGILWISVFFFFGAAGYINHYANIGKEYEPCPVIALEQSPSSKNVTYYCFVELPNGRMGRLGVSYDVYRELSEGDTVYVCSGYGALGVEYAHLRLD